MTRQLVSEIWQEVSAPSSNRALLNQVRAEEAKAASIYAMLPPMSGLNPAYDSLTDLAEGHDEQANHARAALMARIAASAGLTAAEVGEVWS